MPGNKIGGEKARDTNIKRHGSDFYKRIGTIGGNKPTEKPKGFAANRELASAAGRIGGKVSKKKKTE